MNYSIFIPDKHKKEFRQLLTELTRLTYSSRASVLLEALRLFYKKLKGEHNERTNQNSRNS